jgi:hypothetical protein
LGAVDLATEITRAAPSYWLNSAGVDFAGRAIPEAREFARKNTYTTPPAHQPSADDFSPVRNWYRQSLAVRTVTMATAAVLISHPKSPESADDIAVHSDSTPSLRPSSPSVPPSMFPPQLDVQQPSERRASDSSATDDKAGRSHSAPMNRALSPVPKRTLSGGELPPFLASSEHLSPPMFRAANKRNGTPDSRRNALGEPADIGSSPESSPQQGHANLGYRHSQLLSMRPSEHQIYSNQDYDALMGPKKRHKTSRACDECRRKKVHPGKPLLTQIRCDATSEAKIEQCSSCKRAGVNCSFSRVPMKRGPTKGLEAQYGLWCYANSDISANWRIA